MVADWWIAGQVYRKLPCEALGHALKVDCRDLAEGCVGVTLVFCNRDAAEQFMGDANGQVVKVTRTKEEDDGQAR